VFRRLLMRRSYNRGEWSRARDHAQKLINLPKEQDLARSVIIRSLWNQEEYAEVIRLNRLWDHSFKELSQKAAYILAQHDPTVEKIHHPRIIALHSSQPEPVNHRLTWNQENMTKNFVQEGRRLWMVHPNGWTHWDMPAAFSLAETNPALLSLTAEILLYPWEASTRTAPQHSRSMGSQPSLAFSAGTDSTAAAFLMPENTILGYHRRNFSSMLDHRNASNLLEHMQSERGKKVVDVASNHELIRTHHYKQVGFSSDFACAAHLVLLADTYDIGAIAFGTPLDNSWLMKGRKFREFSETEYYQYWKQRFQTAGFDLLFPLAGISEAGAMVICKSEGVLPHLNSCMRGDGASGCGKCWKCFHKNGPLGRPFDINAKEIQTFLQRRPMPTATHALWALKELNQEHQVPDLQHTLAQDLSWWTSFYPPALEILPSKWRHEITTKIHSHLDEMVQPYALESVNHFDE
jgi:hypothetical protein